MKELEGKDYWGLMSTYSGAGSVQDLKLRKSESLEIIKELRDPSIGRPTNQSMIIISQTRLTQKKTG